MVETRSADAKADNIAGWILIVIFGVIALGLLVVGSTVYYMIIEEWANRAPATAFRGPEGWVSWIFGVCAAIAIGLGLVLVGICIRLARASRGPLASLALSVLSVGFIIFTYYVFSDTNTSGDSFEVVLLQGCCILLLLMVSLPPFLHWALAKPTAARLPTEPRP